MMRRIGLGLLLAAAAAGCRDYDNYSPLASEKGLIPADQWADYGHEQAQAVAIGREFAWAHESDSPDALARQMGHAIEYAESLGVAVVVADTLGHRLTVRFPSGWRLAILPIDDGRRGADTPGISTGAAD